MIAVLLSKERLAAAGRNISKLDQNNELRNRKYINSSNNSFLQDGFPARCHYPRPARPPKMCLKIACQASASLHETCRRKQQSVVG